MPNPTDPSEINWLTAGEAARIIGVSISTVARLADSGKLPVRRLPSGHRRFDRRNVELVATGEEAVA